MEECVFCKIVKGEIPCYKVWEDERSLAFLDINPCSEGHTIVIPKNHTRWVWDLGDEDYFGLMKAVKEVAEILRRSFGVECVEEGIIGFDVGHAHVHLHPRNWKEDGLPVFPTNSLSPKPSEEDMKEILEKIKANV